MNIYTAIHLAADHIERHPALFDFTEPFVYDCGSPGCAIGWITHFRGAAPMNSDFIETARLLTGVNVPDDFGLYAERTFYSRLERIEEDWRHDPAACAHALRQYAETYHGDEKPTEKPEGIPADVRAIFEGVAA